MQRWLHSSDAAKILGCGVSTFNRFFRDKEIITLHNKQLFSKDILNNCSLEGLNSKGTSHYEREIAAYIKSLGFKVSTNNRQIIKPLELDIYVESKNLAIEFDGLYWHSREQDPNKHLIKTLSCESKGIRLMHIFEDEWNFKQDIVKSMIASALGVYKHKYFARKCAVMRISSDVALDFIQKNHIQETAQKLKLAYGLYYEGRLLQVVTVRPNFAQRTSNKDMELARMCTKINCQVVGGFSKLLKFAMEDLNITKMTSFVDRRLFNASGYKSSGWKVVGESGPRYFYTDGFKRENRQKYMKQTCISKWPDLDPNLTEKQMCNAKGLYQIFDCGCIKVECNK